MNLFAVNLILAFFWGALNGSLAFGTLLVGYFVGLGALWIAQPLFTEKTTYFVKSWRSLRLALYFVYELLVSSLQVAWTVLTPWNKPNSAILEMPLDVKSDVEILLVSSLISLTPGTLSLDVSEDRKILFVHAMFGDDPDASVSQLKGGMERLVKEVFE